MDGLVRREFATSALHISVARADPANSAWLSHLRREAPVHALMIAVMGAAMIVGSPIAAVLGALLLVVVAVPCAALSRQPSRAFLRAHVVDLWAMALTLIALLPAHAPSGHHAITVPALAGFATIVIGWAALRLWLGMRARASWAAAAASSAVTGAGLAVMAAVCL